jgi:hypothetical protein
MATQASGSTALSWVRQLLSVIQDILYTLVVICGVRQPKTDRGHEEVKFDSIELGVGMQRWSSIALNWVWACRGGGWQPSTGCGHAAKSTRIRENDVSSRCSRFSLGTSESPREESDISANFLRRSRSCSHSMYWPCTCNINKNVVNTLDLHELNFTFMCLLPSFPECDQQLRTVFIR